MARCPYCGHGWSWRLGDGRCKCRRCGRRRRSISAWDGCRLSGRVKHELVQRFAWGVPVYRQCFSLVANQPATSGSIACCGRRWPMRSSCASPLRGRWNATRAASAGRKGKRGWGAAGKVLVFGIVKRNGMVKALPIAVRDRASVMQVIQAGSREGALFYTDDWRA